MLKKTKLFILIGTVLLIVTVIITLITQSLKPAVQVSTVPVIPKTTTPSTSLLMKSENSVAVKTKATLLSKLPIKISNFDTSVGIKTNILISSFDNDNPEVVRVEISGVDYQYNQNDPNTNPNMVAFKESFEKVKSIFLENQVDIKNLHILLSNRLYIREITENWIIILNLLP